MSTTQLTPVEPGNRIHLPADWSQSLGIDKVVVLERTDEGILVRPAAAASWNVFFANKLTIGTEASEEKDEELEVSGDDLLF
jgi:hypothetical protein